MVGAKENHALLQVWASHFQPGGTIEHMRSWCDQMLQATSAETAVDLMRIGWEADVTDAARKIRCPVLIVHPERDGVVPIEEGRTLASLIPNCRFVQLDSDNHMPLADEPSWPRLVTELKRFLAEEPADVPAAANGRQLQLGELTPRERAVLEGIAAGQNNAEIAASLGLSEKTVRNHITRVFDKIAVEHRYEAIVRAREAGLGARRRLTGTSVPDDCPEKLHGRDPRLNTSLSQSRTPAREACLRMPRNKNRRWVQCLNS